MWVDSPRTIAIHYISRLFILDVISVLPYDIVGMLMPDNAHSLRVRASPPVSTPTSPSTSSKCSSETEERGERSGRQRHW